jgi:hypothetical protein
MCRTVLSSVSVGVVALAGSVSVAGVIPPSTSQFNLGGSAQIVPAGIQLTNPSPQQIGAAYFRDRQFVRNGFDIRFQYAVGVPSQSGGATGEGIAFVIQNTGPMHVGTGGTGIGVTGMTNTLAVVLRTGATQSLDIRAATGSTPLSFSTAPLASVPLSNQQTRQVIGGGNDQQIGGEMRIRYLTGNLEVRLNGGAPIVVNVNLQNVGGVSLMDPNGMAYVGFIAGTSQFRTDSHLVTDLSFNLLPAPGAAAGLIGLAAVIGRRRR